MDFTGGSSPDDPDITCRIRSLVNELTLEKFGKDFVRNTCSGGHPLVLSNVPENEGFCDICNVGIGVGEQVMECRQCNWWMCAGCNPPLVIEGPENDDAAMIDRNTCSGGHPLVLSNVPEIGCCDICNVGIGAGEQVMECRQCDWWMCAGCNPPLFLERRISMQAFSGEP